MSPSRASAGICGNNDGPDTGAVWARWESPADTPGLEVLPDCPAVDSVTPDEACCAYDGHPGAHSYQLTDPWHP